MADQAAGRVFLQQVSGVVDPVQVGVRDAVVQPLAVLRWKDAVLATPQQGDRHVDRAEPLLVDLWASWRYWR